MCFIAAGGCDGTIIHTFFPPSHLLLPSECKLNRTYCFNNIIVSHVPLPCVLLLLVVVMPLFLSLCHCLHQLVS